MTEVEIKEHFDFIDGVQKAQMLVLRSLLSQVPDAQQVWNRYAATLESQDFFQGLSEIQQSAMQRHLKIYTS
jgi:hypothetical protein